MEIDDKLIHTLYYAWCGVLFGIFAPLILYYSVQFWKLKTKVKLFNKRYPVYIIIVQCTLFFHILILRTIADAPEIYSFNYNNDPEFTLTLRLTFYNSIHVIYIMSLIRAWILYIDYTKCKQLIKISWQETLVDVGLPWTVKYTFLSNIKVLSILGISYGITIMVVLDYTFQKHIDWGSALSTTFYVILVLASLFMAYKIRQCRDEYFIHLELKYMGIIFGTMVPMTFIMFQLLCCGNELALIYTIFADICLLSISLINTKFVVNKYKLFLSETMNKSVIMSQYKYIRIERILELKDGFDLFANHLVKELSIEHLIFLFEIMQLKYEVIENGLLSSMNGNIDIGLMYKIGEFYLKKIKRSNFNFEIRNHVNFYEKYVFILYNYIAADGELAVNISAEIRMNILSNAKDIMMDYKYMMHRNSIHKRKSSNSSTTSIQYISSIQRLDVISVPQTSAPDDDLNGVDIGMNPDDDVMIDEDEQQNIIKYLKLIDEAIEDVLRLLQLDSYHRFKHTNSFQKLVQANPDLVAQHNEIFNRKK